MAASRLCSMPDCGKPHLARGFCNSHYKRLTAHGSPTGGRASPAAIGAPLKWLHENVGYQGDECLIWPFAKSRNGYSNIAHRGRHRSAARMMCRLAHGEPPTPEHEAAHNCGNGHKACISPLHLRWATKIENHTDKYGHGTMRMGEDHPCHVLTVPQVLAIRVAKEENRILAARFGVAPGTIRAVRIRKTWAWLQ